MLQAIGHRPSAIGHPSLSTPTPSSNATPVRRVWPIVIFSQRTKAVIRRSAAGTVAVAAGGFVGGVKYAR